MDTQPHDIKITIRLSAPLAEKLRRLAKMHDRSLNGEIVRALRVYGEPSESFESPQSSELSGQER